MRRLLAVLTSVTLLGVASGGVFAGAASAAVSSVSNVSTASGGSASLFGAHSKHRTLPKQVLRLGPTPVSSPARQVPRRQLDSGPATAQINVTYSGFPSDGQARGAFAAAVDIWAHTVHSSVPIDVLADWSNLTATYGPDVLGAAGPTDFVANFTDSSHAKPNVFYPVALANAIAGKDELPPNPCSAQNEGNPSGAEISASFNSSPGMPWYYGTDGGVDVNHVDLESVVLHELAHGLGFVGTFEGLDAVGHDNGNGYFGLTSAGTQPTIFDTFISDGTGKPLGVGAYANSTMALGNVLRGDTGGAQWDGAYAEAANGNGLVPLYSPYPWEEGSSFAHLDESTYPAGNLNALMTPELSPGESEHDPGPVVVGMFKDMGWPDTSTVPGAAGLYHPVPQVPLPRIFHQTGVTSAKTLDMSVTGQFGVPANVTAVEVNVEIKNPTATSAYWTTLGRCRGGPGLPVTGVFSAKQTRTGEAVIPVDSSGHIKVWISSGSAEVNVDVIGYYSPDGLYYHQLPSQQAAVLKYVDSATPLDVAVAGQVGIPATGVTSVVFKARVSEQTAQSWFFIGPGGVDPRIPSSAYAPNQFISQFVTVPLGTDASAGMVRLRVAAGRAKVQLTAIGYYDASADGGMIFHSAGPGRYQPPLHGSQLTIAGLPDSTPVMFTVHLSNPNASGYVSAGPAGSTVVNGVLEYYATHPASATTVATTDSLGRLQIHLSAGVSTVYVDALGWFAAT